MESQLFIIVLFFLGLAGAVFLINKKISELKETNKTSEELLSWLHSTSTRLDEQNKNFTNVLTDSTKTLNERLDNAARVISQVQKNIGEMSEIGRGMKDLQEFLRSPKLRGNIGEQVLKELLGQMLPKNSFNLQYSFKSGVIVDAAIKTTAGIIPIDSKFPMENFRKMTSVESEAVKKEAEKEFVRDVKKHIDSIASKYILTDEGTIDYALMYVPSEAVYYEIVNNNDLFDYSGNKKVLPVSPTTFYAYLQAILMSFEGQKIEVRAKEILTSLKAIQKDYTKLDENLGILGRHLQNAYNQMTNVSSGFNALGQKLNSAGNLGEGVKEEIKQLKNTDN